MGTVEGHRRYQTPGVRVVARTPSKDRPEEQGIRSRETGWAGMWKVSLENFGVRVE